VNGTLAFFVILSAIVVFAIAAGTIGREARRLDAVAPRVVYDIEEATQFVADRLPEDTQARLTYDEVRELLRAHLAWLNTHGLQPDKAEDQVQNISDKVVMDDTTLAAYLLSESAKRNVQVLDDVDVVHVVTAHLQYFAAIGAVGPQAADA
jgi:hypothetical protein